jgi:lipoate-protein ligase B
MERPLTSRKNPASPSRFEVFRGGVLDYRRTWELQKRMLGWRIEGRTRDTIMLVEHDPPVITMGSSGKKSHIKATKADLAEKGIEVIPVERGGDVTLHCPGQLVVYPIIDLKELRQDLHWYMRKLEEAMVFALAGWGIEGRIREGLTGAWVGDRKIGSVGIGAKNWVTCHGLSLNISPEMEIFDLIVPCGLKGVKMTSVKQETGHAVPIQEAGDRLVEGLERSLRAGT